MLLSDWLEQWYVLRSDLKPTTLRGYRAALAHVPAPMLATDLHDITPLMWQQALNALASSYPRQAQLLHAALRSSWNDALRLQLVPADCVPYRYVKPVKHRTRPIAYLLPEEMSSYARAAMQTKAAVPLLLMLCCGLRRGEALGLQWSHIDQRGMILRIDCAICDGILTTPKSRTSVRDIPICAELLEVIKKHGDKGSRFCYNGGVKQLYAAHREALRRAQIAAPVTLHGLRHSCATAALAEGADIKTVQQILGHATFAVTADIYCHALMGAERAAVNAVVTRLEIA